MTEARDTQNPTVTTYQADVSALNTQNPVVAPWTVNADLSARDTQNPVVAPWFNANHVARTTQNPVVVVFKLLGIIDTQNPVVVVIRNAQGILTTQNAVVVVFQPAIEPPPADDSEPSERIPDPWWMEFDAWADAVCLALAPFGYVPLSMGVENWKEWANNINAMDGVSEKLPPDAREFEDWRVWGEQFLYVTGWGR